MEIKAQSQINAKELYQFLLYHSYSTVWGFTGVLISVCALFAFISMTIQSKNIFSGIGFLLVAILFLVIQPIRLYIQAQRIMAGDIGYQKPIDYVFNHRGISLAQDDAEAFYGWQDIRKIVTTKKVLAIYAGKDKVLKLSRNDITEQYEELKELFGQYAIYAVKKLK